MLGLKNAVKKSWTFVKEVVPAKAAGVITGGTVTLYSVSAFAEGEGGVTLPTMPVNFSDYATAGMVVVGTVLGAIAGIVVVVALTRMGLRKLAGAFSGRA